MELQLMNGDCLELLQGLDDASIDLVLADPPYGTTDHRWDSVLPFEQLWGQLLRVTRENSAIVMTACQPFTTKLINSNPDLFRYTWVWVKPQGVDPLNSRRRPLNNIEDVVVFYKKLPTYNPQFSRGKPYTRKPTGRVKLWGSTDCPNTSTGSPDGRRYPKRTLHFGQERGYHPTQKPVLLMEYLIRTYTNLGERVLDFSMGSGSTGVAAVQAGRDFVGMELDEAFYDMACNRIGDAQYIERDEVWLPV